jgi:hypothetical protein
MNNINQLARHQTFQLQILNCGHAFGICNEHKQRCFDRKQKFWCPECGKECYYGDTELDRARQEVIRLKSNLDWANSRAADARQTAEHERRRAAAIKGVLTKTKKRIGQGVCPCCNRQFQNLERHMTCKHPNYKTE